MKPPKRTAGDTGCTKRDRTGTTKRGRIGVLEAIWLAALVTVPSAVNPFANARFDPEKALLVRSWGLMAAVALLAKWAWARYTTPRAAPNARRVPVSGEWPTPDRERTADPGRIALVLLAAVAGSAVLSGVCAISPGAAWFGSVSRGGGVLTILACAALFAAVATDCRRRVQVERLLLAAVLGSLMPTVFGWMQAANVTGLAPSGFFPENRPWATFGNAIALGSYLAGVLPATAYLVWRSRGWRRTLPGALLLAQLVLLYLTASRGPILGFVSALSVAALLVARRHGWRNAALAGAVAFVTLFVVFLGGIQLVAQSELVRVHTRTGMLTRFNTVEVRVQLYRAMTARMLDGEPLRAPDGAVDAWGRWRPWIGYGPECLAEPLLSRLSPRFEQVEGYDRVPDSTHSQMMDVLGGTGVLGLGLHFALIAALLRVGCRALGIHLARRERRLCRGCMASSAVVGLVATVSWWGAFAWALGVLAGLYVGVLLATAVALTSERAVARQGFGWVDAAVLAVVPLLMGLWVEAQFGIPLVASALLFHLGGGLLVALARMDGGPAAKEVAAGADEVPEGLWVPVAVLGACVMVLTSLLDNRVGRLDAWSVLRDGFGTLWLWILPFAAVCASAWWLPARLRRRALPVALLGAVGYMVLYADLVAGLRTSTLRSVPEIIDWGMRMQAVAGWRLVPILLLPVLLFAGAWRTRAACLALALACVATAGSVLWDETRHDILMVAARQTAEHGEPGAAVKVIEQSVGRDATCVHAAQHASEARLFGSRAAKLEAKPDSTESLASRWESALRPANQAVRLRPLYAPHHAELGGTLQEAANATTDPVRRLALAKASERAYAAAVALTPGLTVHKRRLAGVRYTLLRDAAGARRALEETLVLDDQNPVALSMLAKWTYHAGMAAESDDAKAELYRQAVLLAERCLRSRTIAANRVDVRSTRAELASMQRWFLERGREVPTLPVVEIPQVRYVAPKLPTPADRGVIRLLLWRAALALAIALVLTPCLRRFARRVGFVDAPAARKLHVEPTPLLGGVAIAAAVVAASLGVAMDGGQLPLASVLAVASGLALVGLVDDRRPLPWWAKLAAQCVAAGLLYAADVRVQLAWLPGWLNFALTLAWLVGITNAVNFLDNMNGLSAGLSALAAMAIVVLGVLNEGWAVAGVAAAVAGACFGFLRYNHHWHATIFMGDTGSLFLGSLLASLALLLRFPANHNWVTWLCPVLLLAVPVFDMTHVCLARLRRGKNPFSTPGKDHTSHLLARMGLQRHGAVLAIHAAVIACGVAAGVVAYASPVAAYAVAGMVLAFAVFLLLYFELRFGQGGTDAT